MKVGKESAEVSASDKVVQSGGLSFQLEAVALEGYNRYL
jgi:hypothetical protein